MSAAKCDPGWGDGLSSRTVPRLIDHPTRPLRVDPPPPGEGMKSRALASPRNDVVSPHSRDAIRPSFVNNFLPSQSEGAGNAGRPMRPQPRVRKS